MKFPILSALYDIQGLDGFHPQLSVEVRKQLPAAAGLHFEDILHAFLNDVQDDQLIMFDPAEPFTGISEGTYAEVAKALKQCKEYRTEHPRESKRPQIDKMVENVLEQGELN